MLRHMLFADVALARRIEGAECRLSIGIAQAVVARAGDAFVVRLGGGAGNGVTKLVTSGAARR
jgi:hypothetical protein